MAAPPKGDAMTTEMTANSINVRCTADPGLLSDALEPIGRDGMSAQVCPDLTSTVEYDAKLKRYSV
jgi:hypothetical protein